MSQGDHLAGAAGASLAPLSYIRCGLLLYVNDDDGDVIVAAGVQGGGEQEVGRPLGVVWGVGQNLRDSCLRDHVREPGRTEQDAVASLYGQDGGRHLGHGFPLCPAEPYGDYGGTHPRELLVAAPSGHYPTVRLSYGRFEGFVRLEIFEDVYGEGARYLPGLEAAYAVGDDEERLVLAFADKQGVLVVLANLASVGDAEWLQL